MPSHETSRHTLRSFPPSALLDLLAEDGIAVPLELDDECRIECPAPWHAPDPERPRPFWIDQASGRYVCHGCGLTGDAYAYLCNVRQWKPEKARHRLRRFYRWTERRIAASMNTYTVMLSRRAGLPQWFEEITPQPQATHWPLVRQHDYRNPHGRLISRVTVWQLVPGSDISRHVHREWTPATQQGGWWLSSPLNPALPAADRVDKRPLYRLPRLPAEHDGPVWVVASEQLVDALHLIRPATVSTAITTVCRAQPQRHFADLHLSPLYRKSVFCIAEQTARSRKGMRELAKRLREHHQARPTLVLPQGEDGWNLLAQIPLGWAAIEAFVNEFSCPTASGG